MKNEMEDDLEVEDVWNSDFIVELKTGAWKKQLNEMTDGSYMVEVYWFSWVYEEDRNDRWEAFYDSYGDAFSVYSKLKQMSIVKVLLPKVAG